MEAGWKASPPARANVLSRPRLFRAIDAGNRARAGVPCFWISGPAGAGKTTLVASYLGQRRLPALWFRVDADDGPAELFDALAAALRRVAPRARPRLALPSFAQSSELESFSRRFFAALWGELPPRAALVLDDYHLLPEASAVHVAMRAAIATATRGHRVLVTSRALPPPPLARAAVHGDVQLLDARALAFTAAETMALGRLRARRRAPALTGAEVRRIHRLTGGWAAATALLVARAGGSHAPLPAAADVAQLFAYLSEEVFASLGERERQVLIATAPLASFSTRDALTLSGDAAAGRLLARLDQDGVLVERLTPGPTASRASAAARSGGHEYRVHPLLRAFLDHWLEQQTPAAHAREIRARAAALLADTGRCEAAFSLYEALGDTAHLVRIVAAHGPPLAMSGRYALVARWLDALPTELIEQQPWLRLLRGMSATGIARAGGAADVEAALAGFEQQGDAGGAYLAWAAGMQHLLGSEVTGGQLERSLAHFARLQARFPELPSQEVGLAVASALVLALTFSGVDPDQLGVWRARALELLRATREPGARLAAAGILMFHHAVSGEFAQAALIKNDVVVPPGQDQGLFARVAGLAGDAVLAWMRGDVAECAGAAEQGLALLQGEDLPFWKDVLLVYEVLAAFDRDDAAVVARGLRDMAAIAESGRPYDVGNYHFAVAWRAYLAGELDQAAAAVQMLVDSARKTGFPFGEVLAHQLGAHLAFLRGDRVAADATLDQARRLEAVLPTHRLLPYWRMLLEADWARRDGDERRLAERLRAALAIGRACGACGGLWPGRAELAELCAFALEREIEPEHVRRMIRVRGLQPGAAAGRVAAWPWPIKVRALGELSVWQDDQPLPTGPRAQRTPMGLLRALVSFSAYGGRSVAGERLAEALWPDADGDTALRTLDVTLLRLRKLLGHHDAVRLHGGRVSLSPEHCWVDAQALRALLEQPIARARHGAEAVADEADAAAAVLDLYRGPLLDGDGAVGPFAGEVERLRGQVGRRLRALLDRLRGRDPVRASELAARAREQDRGLAAYLPDETAATARRAMARA